MKYLTTEYYEKQFLMYANKYVKSSDHAYKRNDDFYKQCYERRFKVFMENDKSNPWYTDPKDELRRMNGYLNLAIYDRYRYGLLEYSNFMSANMERLISQKYYKFSTKLCRQSFDEIQRRRIEIYNKLPQKILDNIADIRVFALGFTVPEVKEMLRPYCKNLKNEVTQTEMQAFTETDDAEGYLKNRIGINFLRERLLYAVEQKGKDVQITIDCAKLVIKNATITEGQKKPVYPYNSCKPHSRLICAELRYYNYQFELSCHISNSDEIGKEDFWYLTVKGTDVVKIPFA